MSTYIREGWECLAKIDLFDTLTKMRASALIDIEHDLKRLVVELGGQHKMSGRFELSYIISRLISTEGRSMSSSTQDFNSIFFIKKVGEKLVFLARNQKKSYPFMHRIGYLRHIPYWDKTDKLSEVSLDEWDRRGALWADFYKVKEFVKYCIIDPENPELLISRILIPELSPEKDQKNYWNVPG